MLRGRGGGGGLKSYQQPYKIKSDRTPGSRDENAKERSDRKHGDIHKDIHKDGHT